MFIHMIFVIGIVGNLVGAISVILSDKKFWYALPNIYLVFLISVFLFGYLSQLKKSGEYTKKVSRDDFD